MLRVIGVAIGVIIGILANGQASSHKDKKDLVLFTVEDSPIGTDEFIYLYTKNNQDKNEGYTEKKVLEYLDLFINFKLKVKAAHDGGMDTTRAFKDELNGYLKELKKPYLAEEDELGRLTQEAYQRMLEEINVSHILIKLNPDATPPDTLAAYNKIMTLRDRIVGGENFEKLAREFSDDPTAKANSGNLGFFTVLQMVYPFESAAYQTALDEVSLPVRTRFGYHLIKVNAKRPARGEVEVSHILIRGKDEGAKNKIFQVYDQLKAGRDWNEACKEYSEDQATKENGGKLRPFGVGALASAPAFEETAFALADPGSISDPFQTQYGWHIVRLERKIPVLTFEEMEPALRRRIARDERLQLSQQKLIIRRKQEFGLTEHEQVKITIIKSADSTLTQGKWHFEGDSNLLQAPLITLSSHDVPVSDFVKFVRAHQTTSVMQPADYMSRLYEQFVEDKMDQLEEEKLQRDHPEYRSMVKEYREGILMFGIMEKEVWNKASEDSVGQLKFYQAHTSRYSAGDRVRARIFATPDESLIKNTLERIHSGDTLQEQDLKKFKSVTGFRSYERGENNAIDNIPWSIGLHQTQVDGIYYLVEVMSLVPPGIKSFDEVKASIISDYQEYLEQQWVARLREKYPVKINNKGKKFVLKTLTK